MTAERRIQIEREIVRATIEAAIAKGYKLHSVSHGEGEFPVSTIDAAMKYAFECDEAHIFFREENMAVYSWFYIVLGNSGYDVICDYTVDLEPAIEATNALVAMYEDEYFASH